MTAIRLGLRGLRNAPWFAASIIVVLTVGMTLATVAFAVVERTLFEGPTVQSARTALRAAGRHARGATRRPRCGIVARDRILGHGRSRTDADDDRGAAADYPIDGIAPVMATVDRTFLDVLGVKPLLGGFSAEDFEKGADASELRSIRPMLLSHRLWRLLTGGDRMRSARRA